MGSIQTEIITFAAKIWMQIRLTSQKIWLKLEKHKALDNWSNATENVFINKYELHGTHWLSCS